MIVRTAASGLEKDKEREEADKEAQKRSEEDAEAREADKQAREADKEAAADAEKDAEEALEEMSSMATGAIEGAPGKKKKKRDLETLIREEEDEIIEEILGLVMGA